MTQDPLRDALVQARDALAQPLDCGVYSPMSESMHRAALAAIDASLAAQAPAAPAPMTDERIMRISREYGSRIDFARAIERELSASTAAQPAPAMPFLLRELAAVLGVPVPELSQTIARRGLGNFSQGMEVPPAVVFAALRGWAAEGVEAAQPAPSVAEAKDAARWRYWRDHRSVYIDTGLHGNGCRTHTADELDAATDVRIAAALTAQAPAAPGAPHGQQAALAQPVDSKVLHAALERYGFTKNQRYDVDRAIYEASGGQQEQPAPPAQPAPSAAEWIGVTDRLPEKFVEVLIAFAGQNTIASTGQYTDNPRDKGGWCYPAENNGTCDDGSDPVVTHWMPLPAPQAQQEPQR